MQLTIFGAAGQTGGLLVDRALEDGHDVTAFARDATRVPGEGRQRLRIVEGDVLDAGLVAEAVRGADAVLSALGPAPGAAETVMSDGLMNIVAAMKELGVERLVALTDAGVPDPHDRPARGRLMRLLSAFAARDDPPDVRRAAAVVEASGLEWTLVRAPRLVDGPPTGDYRVGFLGPESGLEVVRADVAVFMLKQVRDRTYLREAPLISARKAPSRRHGLRQSLSWRRSGP